MEEPLQAKDEASAPEEPVKSENVIPNAEAGERADGIASPPPNCSICLGKLINTSFTDSCLHQFCFACLLQWSKIKAECPLCKQTFMSIIHNVRSEEDYDLYDVPRELAATLDVNFDVGVNVDMGSRRFTYRTTMARNRRYHMEVDRADRAQREQLWRDEQNRRGTNSTDFRRNVYRMGNYSIPLPDTGRYRECSVSYYRRYPNELTRLIPWLNRELQVLLNDNAPHIAYVLRIIMNTLTRYDLRSPEFRDLIRPYFNTNTDHFVHELMIYACAGYDLVGYDQNISYLPRNLFSNRIVPHISPVPPSSSRSSTSSDDSEVRVLDETINTAGPSIEVPSVGPHTVDMPGPSTVGQVFDPPPYAPDYVFTISSNSSLSENECEVVGYVKPRHERTPEIIDLLSSDVEQVTPTPTVEEPQVPSPLWPADPGHPSTSYEKKSKSSRTVDRKANEPTSRNYSLTSSSASSSSSSSSDSSESDSDSDYDPRRGRRGKARSKGSSKGLKGSKSSKSSKGSKTSKTSKSSRPSKTSKTRTRDRKYSDGLKSRSKSRRKGTKSLILSSSDSEATRDLSRERKKRKTSKTLTSDHSRKRKALSRSTPSSSEGEKLRNEDTKSGSKGKTEEPPAEGNRLKVRSDLVKKEVYKETCSSSEPAATWHRRSHSRRHISTRTRVRGRSSRSRDSRESRFRSRRSSSSTSSSSSSGSSSSSSSSTSRDSKQRDDSSRTLKGGSSRWTDDETPRGTGRAGESSKSGKPKEGKLEDPGDGKPMTVVAAAASSTVASNGEDTENTISNDKVSDRNSRPRLSSKCSARSLSSERSRSRHKDRRKERSGRSSCTIRKISCSSGSSASRTERSAEPAKGSRIKHSQSKSSSYKDRSKKLRDSRL
ncbi:E3 ubiquitin-protein ligase Topors isoform X2 [Orussus abietinus]|uniref:E3 ubiquitin-protein ligase Topors isoform X2 n=1 Tax=Orussus abietinus TaxID=222816 RepID=UPI000626856A|nr:E3 ubiquitin-protein ligase Topors isoform X2 [Orussus abietinus]